MASFRVIRYLLRILRRNSGAPTSGEKAPMSGNKKFTRPADPFFMMGGYQPGAGDRRGYNPPGGRQYADQAPLSKPPSNPPNRDTAGKK